MDRISTNSKPSKEKYAHADDFKGLENNQDHTIVQCYLSAGTQRKGVPEAFFTCDYKLPRKKILYFKHANEGFHKLS